MMMINDIIKLPPGSFPLEHQVAGHFSDKNNTKISMLGMKDGFVLKAVQSKLNGERELEFFQKVFSNNNDEMSEHKKFLRKFLPNYIGYFDFNKIKYIKMKDITDGIPQPNILDIKIGRKTHDPSASPEKISRQKLKYPNAESIGFIISGMRIFDQKSGAIIYRNKTTTQALNKDDIIECLESFFQFKENAIRGTLRKLEEIKNWFKTQYVFNFYSSSVLIVYDSEKRNDEFDDISVRIKMIDFTHVVVKSKNLTNEIDNNYIEGLDNLISHIKKLLRSG